AIRGREIDGGVEDELEHVIEDAARAQRAQLLEQRGDPPQVRRRYGRGAARGERIDEKDNLGRTGRAELNPIAALEHAFGDALAVDVGAVARASIVQNESLTVPHDPGVSARDVPSVETQVALRVAADVEAVLVDRNDTPPLRVGDFQARFTHSAQR